MWTVFFVIMSAVSSALAVLATLHAWSVFTNGIDYLLVGALYVVVFFFSSRRRHTRSYGDWSSDVCSSDLPCLRRRRSQEDEARRTRVGARGSPFHDVVDAAQLVVVYRRRQPAVLGARLEEEQVERCLVERRSHERSSCRVSRGGRRGWHSRRARRRRACRGDAPRAGPVRPAPRSSPRAGPRRCPPRRHPWPRAG